MNCDGKDYSMGSKVTANRMYWKEANCMGMGHPFANVHTAPIKMTSDVSMAIYHWSIFHVS